MLIYKLESATSRGETPKRELCQAGDNKEEYPDVTTMTVQWVSDSNDEDLKKVNDFAIQGAPIAEAPMEEQINEAEAVNELVGGDEMAAPVEAVPMYDLWDDLQIADADGIAPW